MDPLISIRRPNGDSLRFGGRTRERNLISICECFETLKKETSTPESLSAPAAKSASMGKVPGQPSARCLFLRPGPRFLTTFATAIAPSCTRPERRKAHLTYKFRILDKIYRFQDPLHSLICHSRFNRRCTSQPQAHIYSAIFFTEQTVTS